MLFLALKKSWMVKITPSDSHRPKKSPQQNFQFPLPINPIWKSLVWDMKHYGREVLGIIIQNLFSNFVFRSHICYPYLGTMLYINCYWETLLAKKSIIHGFHKKILHITKTPLSPYKGGRIWFLMIIVLKRGFIWLG